MKRLRNLFFYIGTIGGFSALMYWIVQLGGELEPGMNVTVHETGESQLSMFTETFIHNLTHPLAILLLQIVTIILVARLFGWFCKKIGQPTVIGEIIAGIVLGPSLLGMYFPGFSAALFPVQSLGNLQFLSQIGLILFMFVIGMELDLKVLKNQAHEAVVVSHASIIIPFTLGMGLAYFIYSSFAPQGVPFASFGLFLGISMSITAFPVLARIVQERGIYKTRLGAIVITCAAADDITAWSLLAAVIAIAKAGSFISSMPTILMALVYVFVMLKLVMPFLKRVGDLHTSRENLSKSVVAIFFLVLLLSSYATEIIGIHALFGAFMAGVIMPDNQKFKQIFIEKVEDVALVLLLPLFFVFTGLRTQIGLLNDPYLWKICGLVILVAVTGKFAGSTLAAKFVGQSWRDSFMIGALMNTRGLVELVVLNIGYDLGILSSEIFTMLVIMALVTTFMTAPVLHIIDKLFKKKAKAEMQEIIDMGKFKILISFGKPEMGVVLLRLANFLVKSKNGNTQISALHVSPNSLLNKFKMDDYERESFDPLVAESKKLNQPVEKIFKISEDIQSDIVETINEGDYDLLLVGIGHSIFKGSLLGNLLGYSTRFFNPDYLLDRVSGKEKLFKTSSFAELTMHVLAKSKIPVGILIDNNLQNIDRIFLPFFGNGDGFLIEYARKFISNSGVQITIFDATGKLGSDVTVKESLRAIEQQAPDHITILGEKMGETGFLNENDLMLISLEGWEKLVRANSTWLKDLPSALIMRPQTI
ncbi:MAG: transporter [Bacteroidetes bacterium GWF2_42_66]|nr:MAG: transporter [Bacteroidetes bacterium GWA2_42_15]OFY02724.1 MAG: transporter [Bacteroidetes bacterium GWE2_42_39]OFY43923.1 MAG: transporter [Bacteroidetes bacterium GWF2_42_66]HBL77553.1 cation/H(+) antiporter [Prolixibacteraceae bacterium]HCR89986.1 cation/H(+) antiporter [Prolixibacteraceae bacterium]